MPVNRLATWFFAASLFAGLSPWNAASADDEPTLLLCSVNSRSMSTYILRLAPGFQVFGRLTPWLPAIVNSNPTVTIVNMVPNRTMEVVEYSLQMLEAVLTSRQPDWSAETHRMVFRINRHTGAVTITPTETQFSAPNGIRIARVTGDVQTGTCQRTTAVF